jgi:hypothetical protein
MAISSGIFRLSNICCENILFRFGNDMLFINVTQSTFPLIVEFNALQVLPFRELTSQLQPQGYSLHMYPILGPTWKPGICPEWMDVGWNTGIKDTLPFLMRILWARLDLRALERL